MASGRRLATSALLILAGLALAGFFALLLGIADCSAQCVANGERAPAIALIGVGVGLAVMGATMIPQGARRGVGWGALAAGAIILGGALYVLAQGARGAQVYVPLAVGAGDAAVGAWLALRPPR